jgi:signal transduction histidine kinase
MEVVMLHEFLTANRDELVARCRAKVALRPVPQPTATELEFGIPLFLDQLIKTLRVETETPLETASQLPAEIGSAAGKHGSELLRKGFTIDQVVHDYGDLCQSVTELAAERAAQVTVDEFRTFNLCLDNAIADAVTEFGRQRDLSVSAAGTLAMNERLGHLAHDLRNLLGSAILAFEAIKSGTVALTGATGAVLDRSLLGLRDVIDRTLLEVRLSAGLPPQRQRIAIGDLLDEHQVAAALDAKVRGIAFSVSPVDRAFAVEADRQMLGSALSNLLQNAFKFTRRGGRVVLSARAASGRVLIEVEDECGGLPAGKAETLFKPFEQAGDDRSGLGLGLSISRRAVEANGGRVSVRDIPGKGCVFTIELSRLASE